MTKAFLLVATAYVLAGAAAIGTGFWFHTQSPIVIVGLADLAATIVVFLFSVATKNSSLYDPYWSVAPVPIALFWLLQLAPMSSPMYAMSSSSRSSACGRVKVGRISALETVW